MNKLELRNGRWFENGRFLPKKDYIYHASSHESPYILSNRTGEKYKLSDRRKVVYA